MEKSLQFVNSVFQQSKLAIGIDESNFINIFKCLNAVVKSYKKNEPVFDYDEQISQMAIVLKGSVDFSIVQFDGSIALIDRLNPSDNFAEVFACGHQSIGDFEYRCVEDTDLLCLDIPKACTEKAACTNMYKYKVMENMMSVIAENNIFLTKKIFILSQKKLRDKLLTYFKMLKPHANEELWIPFNRQELANFIASDRSAVSRELMRMQKDGLIEINVNKIKITEY